MSNWELLRTVVITIMLQSWLTSQSITFTTLQTNVAEGQTAVTVADFARSGQITYAAIDTEFIPPVVQTPLATYSVGAGADEILNADFNHDAALDLAIANAGERSISVLFGIGDGTFKAEYRLQVGGRPRAIAAADFNADGNSDLAVFACDTFTVCYLEVYRYNETTTFQRVQRISVPGGKPRFKGMMVTARLTNDRKPDIALIADNRTVVIYAPGTSGTLARISSFSLPTGAQPASLAAGSFSSEQEPSIDLAIRVIDGCGGPCGYNNSALAYLNNGNAGFTKSAEFPIQASKYGGFIAAGDINGDQKQDIVTVTADPYDSTLEYATGNANGKFNTSVKVTQLPHALNAPDVTNLATSVLLRRVNRDSRLDIVYSGYDALGNDMAGVFNLFNNNSATNCGPPTSAFLAVRVCSISASLGSIRISASGNSPGGVNRMEVWLDTKKSFVTWDDQLKTTINVPAGTHRVVVISVDRDGTRKSSAATYVAVQ